MGYGFGVFGPIVTIAWFLDAAPPDSAERMSLAHDCVRLSEARPGKVWRRVAQPTHEAFCERLALASSRFAGAPASLEDVLQLCDDAERLVPGRAEPRVLKARALLEFGAAEEALEALMEAKRRDERVFEDPRSMLALARASARTGRGMQAIAAFRAVLPRASTLSRAEGGEVAFEAAMALTAAGPEALDEAMVLLRRACLDAEDALRPLARIALALTLDRAGRGAEASVPLQGIGLLTRDTLAKSAIVSRALANAGALRERDALAAMALERSRPSDARAAWVRYVQSAGNGGPWLEHARAKLGQTQRKRAP